MFETLTFITKTYLYTFDPLKPHFYVVNLVFTGVYSIFHISAQKHRVGYSLEPPHRDDSKEHHSLCFVQKYEKYQNILSENFHFLVVKFSVYLDRHVFVMLLFLCQLPDTLRGMSTLGECSLIS